MVQPLLVHSALRRTVALGVGLTLVALVALAFHAFAGRSGCGCVVMKNTKVTIHTVQESMVHYWADNADQCPPSLQALVDGRYLTKLPRDEWGHVLQLKCRGSREPAYADADVTSAGKDGRFGTADDIDPRNF